VARLIIPRSGASVAATQHPQKVRSATRTHDSNTDSQFVQPTAPADESRPIGREPEGKPHVENAVERPADPAEPVPPPTPSPYAATPGEAAEARPVAAVTPSPPLPSRKSSPPPASVAPAEPLNTRARPLHH